MATGLALAGLRPVVALYSTFSQRAYDQLVHDVCQNGAPVLLAIDRAGLVGEDGTSHQGMFTLSAQRSLPNLVIGSPKDEQELRDMVVTAMAARRTDLAALPARRGRGPAGSNRPGAGDRSGRGPAIGRRPAAGGLRADRAAPAGGRRPSWSATRPDRDRDQRPLGEAAGRGVPGRACGRQAAGGHGRGVGGHGRLRRRRAGRPEPRRGARPAAEDRAGRGLRAPRRGRRSAPPAAHRRRRHLGQVREALGMPEAPTVSQTSDVGAA